MGMKMLSVALAAIALGAVTVAPASAAPEGNKIVEIRSVAHDLCLATWRDKVTPSLATCTGSPEQQFERITAATGGVILRNVAEGTCLDRLSTGWQLYEVACDAEAASQRVELVPGSAGIFKLRVQGKVAESPYPDLGVFFEEESAHDVQQWRIREVGVAPPPQELGAVVRLRHADRKTCVTESGTKAVMEPCTASTGQAFRRVDLGEGKVGLRSTTSDNCLTNLRSDDVALVPCSATATAQQWTLGVDELNYYKIANTSSGRYLTPDSSDSVATFPYWQIGNSQKWELPAA
jgi:hypothetical protein